MTDEDLLKKIKDLIKENLRPVKDITEVIRQKVGSQEFFITNTAENIRRIKEQQSVMNEKLDNHTQALVTIESKISIYGDTYKLNNDNMKKLEIPGNRF